MSAFMKHFKANLSKEVGRMHDWKGTIYDGRYRSIPVSHETKAQLARLKYVLSQSSKEGLVASPRDWPGVHSAIAMSQGKPLRGTWINRTKLHAAWQRGEKIAEAEVSTEEEFHLVPLPCLAYESPLVQQRLIKSMIKEIEGESTEKHRASGTSPVGVDAICRRHPHDRADDLRRSPKPRFHAIEGRVRKALLDAYREFVAAYRRAALKLKSGDRTTIFPENCFPPPLPFALPSSVSQETSWFFLESG